MRQRSRILVSLTGLLLLELLPLAIAHGNDEHHSLNVEVMATNSSFDASTDPYGTGNQTGYWTPSYFSHGEFTALIVVHAALMTLAWAFILPISELSPSPVLEISSGSVAHEG